MSDTAFAKGVSQTMAAIRWPKDMYHVPTRPMQTLAEAAVWTCQLLPAPVHLKQLIRGKHNSAGFSEPDLLPYIWFIFFCSCVPHNMNCILFNLPEFLASIHSVTWMACIAPSVGKYFSKLLEHSFAVSVVIVIMN